MNKKLTSLDADNLYACYGKPLEGEHHGEYVAISQDGRVIVGKDDVAVVDQAIRTFGSGNFIFHRIGYSYVWKLRALGRLTDESSLPKSRLLTRAHHSQ